MTCNQPSAPVTLAICGDPIVSRALALLLQGHHYDARFLPLSSAGDLEPLDGMQLVVLSPTPELSASRREILVASLADRASTAGIPILELVATSGQAQVNGVRNGLWRSVPWPCGAEQLKRCIEEIMFATIAAS